jgi:IclR family transcriptional regulator, acetate operon repressor
MLLLVAAMPETERTVANIAHQLGTTVSTTYHLLNTLVDEKFLARDDSRRYQLGIHIGVLSTAYQGQTSPPAALVLPLKSIADATGESVYLSMWRDGNIEIQAQLTGHHAVRVADLRPGFHSNAHARASGKVLLAFTEPNVRERYLSTHPLAALTPHTITDMKHLIGELTDVLERGYATEEEEFAEGVACIAVPVLTYGFLQGAYTVSAPVERYRSLWEEYLGHLQSGARQADLGLLDPPPAISSQKSLPCLSG